MCFWIYCTNFSSYYICKSIVFLVSSKFKIIYNLLIDFKEANIIKFNYNVYKSAIFLLFIVFTRSAISPFSSSVSAKCTILIWFKHPPTCLNVALSSKWNLYYLSWIRIYLHYWWEILNKFETLKILLNILICFYNICKKGEKTIFLFLVL